MDGEPGTRAGAKGRELDPLPVANLSCGLLFERFDAMEGLVLHCQIPKFKQLGLMQSSPFNNHAQDTRRRVAGNDHQSPNIHLRLEFAILGVEMRRKMIAEEHLDADAPTGSG